MPSDSFYAILSKSGSACFLIFMLMRFAPVSSLPFQSVRISSP